MDCFDSDAERPSGRLEPPASDLSTIEETVDDRRFKEAIDAIETYGAPSSYHDDWAQFLKGRAFFGLEYFEAGYNAFDSAYQRTKKVIAEDEEVRRFRLGAMALKKMGWLHRRNEEFERAYALHAIQYRYAVRYGSYKEIHDATLSLDVDAYFLKNPTLSRMWLERGVEAAESIEADSRRFKALGMTWNNLAGTLCELGQFEKSEAAIEASLDAWSRYEQEEGAQEHRRVWAQYGVSDVYQRWGQYLAEVDDEEAESKFKKARSALTQAMELAEEQDMPTGERQPLQSKLHRIRAELSEEPESSEEDASD